MLDELAPIKIDLNIKKKNKLDESFLSSFGSLAKMLLGYIFGDTTVPVKVKEACPDPGAAPRVKISGTPAQVAAFTEALGNEKEYMLAYMEHGLSDPKTLATRHSLNRAVEEFEKQTGIRWPFAN
jgi:hypothetical protein